jgi:hypothetical protein
MAASASRHCNQGKQSSDRSCSLSMTSCASRLRASSRRLGLNHDTAALRRQAARGVTGITRSNPRHAGTLPSVPTFAGGSNRRPTRTTGNHRASASLAHEWLTGYPSSSASMSESKPGGTNRHASTNCSCQRPSVARPRGDAGVAPHAAKIRGHATVRRTTLALFARGISAIRRQRSWRARPATARSVAQRPRHRRLRHQAASPPTQPPNHPLRAPHARCIVAPCRRNRRLENASTRG